MNSVAIDEAARLLGVSRRSIYNWIAAGRLETLRVGPSQRVLMSSIQFQQERTRRIGSSSQRVKRPR